MYCEYLCYRRREAAATKLIGGGGVPETRLSGGGGAPVVFYHSRKPTAVRSPAGSGGYYLKKSPSPSATPLMLANAVLLFLPYLLAQEKIAECIC
ncbi:hypothetical protein LSTR_LSTR013277 [Laodelphax striatellus]|uniref:Uncharacterized protein n=1 Tax=Laodelphax striatellus TaxID=195883 RepID=A0A482WIL9_LAOST|nr:hypothetical protein LSTR_LSTR013277 [Laodelphax striatellus]